MTDKRENSLLGHIEGKRHIFPLMVFYEDTDAGGIVYHANYLAFAERARSAMLNLLGVSNSSLAERHKVAIAVRHCTLDFRRAARLEDRLIVDTRLIKLGARRWDSNRRSCGTTRCSWLSRYISPACRCKSYGRNGCPMN